MTEKRFMVDDCGTLIDMVTRDTFDYVSDVVGLLNELNDENEQLKIERNYLQSKLHNCSANSRQRTLEEIKEEIEKLERYE